MDEQKIKSLIQQEIRAHSSGARFGLNTIPRHVHNNVDSPYTFQPILTYIGIVNYTATAGLLPVGWTVKTTGTGQFVVTHNLGSDAIYVTTANAIQSTNQQVITVIENFSNEVDFSWFLTSTGALADTSFAFVITVVNNRSTQLPSYYGSMLA